jgi:hypothetical protein
VNVHDVLYFFPVECGVNQRTFLWASEESGFRHIYLITVALGPGTTTNCVDEPLGTQGEFFLKFNSSFTHFYVILVIAK